MRQSSKRQNATRIETVQRYHGAEWNTEDYAYHGFKSNKYFVSDRTIPLTSDFKRQDGKPLKGYGLEIETECDGITNQTVYAEILHKIVFARFADDLFKLQNDGSLRGDTSAECITQIMTKEFIRNNYANFKTMFNDYFPAFKISASRTGNCGMHVNISLGCFGTSDKAQAEAVKKLYYIINKHFDFFCAAFCRNPQRTQYCSKMYCAKDYVKAMSLTAQDCSHGVCFNLGHYNAGRIEIRLVGGQKDFGAFRNTMETVFFLVDRVKNISWADCDSLAEIFKSCNNYVFDRLNTICRRAYVIDENTLARILPTVEAVQYI